MTNNLKNDVNPLTWNVPIVNKDGSPTNEFMRKWQAQGTVNGLIPGEITTAQQVSDLLDLIASDQGDILYRNASGWVVLTPGTDGMLLVTHGPGANPTYETIGTALDQLGATTGDLLYYDGTAWNALPVPTTDGWVLTFDLASGLPAWKVGGGGSGGGVIIGAGLPTALEAAGTLYSRSDAAEVYSSQPTSGASFAVVQSGYQNNSFTAAGVTMTSNPTLGNLMLCMFANTLGSSTVNTADWTILDQYTNGSFHAFIVGRYAQSGDVAAWPLVTTSSAESVIVQGLEVSGATGVFSADFNPTVVHSTTPPVSITTTVNNALLVLVSSHGSGFGAYTPPAGWTPDQSNGAGSNTMDHLNSVPSGTLESPNPAWSVGGNTGTWQLMELTPSGGGLTANWVKVSV